MRKFFEKLIEGGLLISGSVSSFAILLIIFFLFKEATGLFNSPAIEEGYVLTINKTNQADDFTPEKIMDIFDGKITNWKELGGADEDIVIFRFSDLTNYYTEAELGDEFQYVPEKISELVSNQPGIIAFFPHQYLAKNFQGTILPEEKITPSEFSVAPNGIQPLLRRLYSVYFLCCWEHYLLVSEQLYSRCRLVLQWLSISRK